MSKGPKLFVVMTGVVFFFVTGSAMRELTSFKAAGVGTAIGGSALIALFGMFWVADKWKDAITAAVTVTYFIVLAGILGIYVFPNESFQLEGGAKFVLETFTKLVMVVMGSYFGQEALRGAAEAFANGKVSDSGGTDTANAKTVHAQTVVTSPGAPRADRAA